MPVQPRHTASVHDRQSPPDAGTLQQPQLLCGPKLPLVSGSSVVLRFLPLPAELVMQGTARPMQPCQTYIHSHQPTTWAVACSRRLTGGCNQAHMQCHAPSTVSPLRSFALLHNPAKLWVSTAAMIEPWALSAAPTVRAGALACAVARLLQAATRQGPIGHPPQVVAVDLSPVAVEYASLNAGRLGVADMVDVRCGSWCEPCSDLRGAVSGLVSNPPYIPAADMPNLQLEVQWCAPATRRTRLGRAARISAAGASGFSQV